MFWYWNYLDRFSIIERLAFLKWTPLVMGYYSFMLNEFYEFCMPILKWCFPDCTLERICLLTQEMQELRAGSIPCLEDPLEEEMATHSSILGRKIPWAEEPGGLQFMGLQRVGCDLAYTRTYWNGTFCIHFYRKDYFEVLFYMLSCEILVELVKY